MRGACLLACVAVFGCGASSEGDDAADAQSGRGGSLTTAGTSGSGDAGSMSSSGGAGTGGSGIDSGGVPSAGVGGAEAGRGGSSAGTGASAGVSGSDTSGSGGTGGDDAGAGGFDSAGETGAGAAGAPEPEQRCAPECFERVDLGNGMRYWDCPGGVEEASELRGGNGGSYELLIVFANSGYEREARLSDVVVKGWVHAEGECDDGQLSAWDPSWGPGDNLAATGAISVVSLAPPISTAEGEQTHELAITQAFTTPAEGWNEFGDLLIPGRQVQINFDAPACMGGAEALLDDFTKFATINPHGTEYPANFTVYLAGELAWGCEPPGYVAAE